MGKILDILLQKPIAFATKDIIKFAKSSDDRTFGKAVLQLFVDFLTKNYEISDDDLDEIEESQEGFHQMIMEIYESDDIEALSAEVPYNTFMENLISELFIADKLKAEFLTSWVQFFTLIIDEGTIPEEATFKAKSHMMLAFMLSPLAKLVKLSENAGSNVSEDLKVVLNVAIDKIMTNIEASFKYELFGVECAKHLVAAIKIHPTFFIINNDGFKFFNAMLDLDDRTLLALTLTSLTDLCQIESIHDKLREFIFPEEPIEGEEVLIDKIFHLNHHRNLKTEVIFFFSALFKIQNDFLNDKQRYEILMNIFGKNKKIVSEITSMMAAMNLDFWLEIIKMINFYMNPNEIDIPQIITSLGCDYSPKKFLTITCEHINDPVTTERAAEMFEAALKMSEKPSQELSSVLNALPICAINSRVVSMLLKIFDIMSKDEIQEYYKEYPEELKKMIDILADIFEKTQDRMLERIIVNVFYILYEFAQLVILAKLFEMKSQYMKIYREGNVSKKITPLLEIRCWEILNENDLAFLYSLTFTTMKELKNLNNFKNPIYPQFIRLHVNIIKVFWLKILRNQSLPTSEMFPDEVKEFKKMLEECCDNEDSTYEVKCTAIASLMDLLILFQPAMTKKLNFAIFDTINFPLAKEEVVKLAEDAAYLVYDDPSASKEIYLKYLVIHSYESFYISYINLPSLASWDNFLVHYRTKVPFKTEIEHIMEHAMKIKAAIFDKGVAFTILNMSVNYGIDDFRNFYNALEAFLKRHQPNAKDRGIRLATICSYSLEKLALHLKQHQKFADRILPLEFLTVITKNLEPTYKRNLSEFIKLNGLKLTAIEQKKLENFKNMLKE